MSRRLLAIMLLAVVSLVACAVPSPTPARPNPTTLSAATPTSAPSPTATPTVAAVDSGPLVPAARVQTPWVRARLEAVEALYRITPEGQAVLANLDVRQMAGQPGFFGSYGFHGWTGLGEAKPIQVMHELAHSYWGAFPVSERPDLSWDTPAGKDVSSAMEQYHRDVLAFLAQPPDAFEPLRERLRLLPALTLQNTDPLFHTIEADLIYTVGGDLSLVPPIVRRYWDRLLQPGPFRTWRVALAWYQSLPDSDRAAANGYLGFEHFDLRGYRLPRVEGARAPAAAFAVLGGEERQRLSDFASQFDAMLGRPEQAEDFNFWRGYLRDMLRLRTKHPAYLRSLNTPRAADIDSALAFLDGLRVFSSASDAAARLAQGLLDTPFLANFLPAVDDAPLLALFSSGASLPQGATLVGTTAFVELLRKLTPLANDALAAGRADPPSGAARLAASLGRLGLEDKQQLDQFLGIMSDADHQTTRRIVARLDDGLLRKLLAAVPARMRSLLEPARLADALDIADSAPASALVEGLRALVRDTAGNHLIDEPFLDHAYGVLSRRGNGDASGTLAVLRGSALPMQRYVRTRPQDVARILASDVETASTLVAASDTTTYPPALFVHDLVYADPALAASIVGALDRRGMFQLVVESLANLAYDADRLAADPGTPVSLAKDGAFLAALLHERSEDWLSAQIGQTVAAYRAHVERGEVAQDFLDAFRRTLDGAIATVSDQPPASALSRAAASALR